MLDMKIESFFYQQQQFSENEFYHFIFDYGAIPGEALAVLSFFALVFSFFSKKWTSFRFPALVYVMTVLIGAGLLVHVVLKDHWGRPRPRQTIEFGGIQEYRPYYSPNFFHQPEPSKSFPCGHCSMGFCFFALVFIGRRLNKPWLITSGWCAAWLLGGVLSVTRMAQGGHFFSDVLMTALIMWVTAYACDYYAYAVLKKKTVSIAAEKIT